MKDINLTREEALELPIMKYTNEAGFHIDLSLQEINEIMGFNLNKDSDIIDRLLSYKVNGYGIFAVLRVGDTSKIMADPQIKYPDPNKKTVFDAWLNREKEESK